MSHGDAGFDGAVCVRHPSVPLNETGMMFPVNASMAARTSAWAVRGSSMNRDAAHRKIVAADVHAMLTSRGGQGGPFCNPAEVRKITGP